MGELINEQVRIVVREFNAKKDTREVEEVERRCEVGASGKLSLFTDLLGDPICRVRHSPAYLMLVAEIVVRNGVEEKKGNSRDDKGLYQNRYVWKETLQEQSRFP